MVSHRDERLFLGGGTVLILIVMDNGLSLMSGFRDEALFGAVLILIVMDNGLSRRRVIFTRVTERCLNPYCNG